MNKPPYYRSDKTLGWAPKEDIVITKMQAKSAEGAAHLTDFSTDRNGFRYSENDWTRPLRKNAEAILVIGDSFTGDAYTSDRLTWLHSPHQRSGDRAFAYGTGGPGTYQQALALQKLLPLVHPDLIILQACTNDIGNNDPSMIFNGTARNQELRRPYLGPDGQPFVAEGPAAHAYRWLFSNSQLFAYLDNQLAKRGMHWLPVDPGTRHKAQMALST
jgi:hypothetical protein